MSDNRNLITEDFLSKFEDFQTHEFTHGEYYNFIIVNSQGNKFHVSLMQEHDDHWTFSVIVWDDDELKIIERPSYNIRYEDELLEIIENIVL